MKPLPGGLIKGLLRVLKRILHSDPERIDVRSLDEIISRVLGCLIINLHNVFEWWLAKGPRKAQYRVVDFEILAIIHRLAGQVDTLGGSACKLPDEIRGQHELELFYKMGHQWRIVEDPLMQSARKRKADGTLENAKVQGPGFVIVVVVPPGGAGSRMRWQGMRSITSSARMKGKEVRPPRPCHNTARRVAEGLLDISCRISACSTKIKSLNDDAQRPAILARGGEVLHTFQDFIIRAFLL